MTDVQPSQENRNSRNDSPQKQDQDKQKGITKILLQNSNIEKQLQQNKNKNLNSRNNNQGENSASTKNDELNSISSIGQVARLSYVLLIKLSSSSNNEEQTKKTREKYFQTTEKKTELEEKIIQPFDSKEILKMKNQQRARTVNFMSLSAWIISFALARSKNLQGIDTEYGEQTYRNWLQSNANITIILAIVFYMFNITLTKLFVSETPDEQQPANENKQSQPIEASKSNSIKQSFWKSSKFVKNIILKVYEVVMTLSVVAILMIKVFWLLKGLFFFLELNFQETSSYVLAFSFIQFGVFFGYGILLLIKLIIFRIPSLKKKEPKDKNSQQLAQTENKSDKKDQNKEKQTEQKIDQTEQKQLKRTVPQQDAQKHIDNFNEKVKDQKSREHQVEKEKTQTSEQNQEEKKDSKQIEEKIHEIQKIQTVKLQSRSLIFYTNMQDFHYLVKTFVDLFIFSFGQLILWKKNLSLGFQIEAQNCFSLWMIADISVMMGIFVVLTFTLYRMRAQGKELIMWRHQEKGLLYIELTWFNENKFWKYLLIIMLMIKVGLAFFGLNSFMQNLDIEKSHPIMLTFMAVYFTQTIFLIIEGSAIFINGHRSSWKLDKERESRKSQTMVQNSGLNIQEQESKVKVQKKGEHQLFLLKQKTN